MDIKELNLNEEQLKGVQDYVTEYTAGEVTKAKEVFKDYVSKEDLNKQLQSSSDRVRTEYSKKMKDLQDELVKYKPKDKSESEIALENRLKTLEDKEKKVQAKEKLLNISDKLKEQGLPQQLAKYLSNIEDDKVETEVNSLKTLFNNLALNNSFVPSSHKAKNESITKEQFKKMSMIERENLYTTNKELYNKLSE